MTENGNGALSGVRILDLTSYLAGPYGASLLGDSGADVIKVEPPDGDMMRHYPTTLASESRAFLGANRNKRGIVVDLKKPEGRRVIFDLVGQVDVLIQNFRPSVPPRLGVDYETLSAINPRLIYCGLTGYGEQGPWRDNAGFDQVLQSMSGIAAFQGGDGPPQVVVGSIVDYYASSLIAYGVSAALYRRELSGKGQRISVSLLRTAIAMQAGRFIWAESEPREVSRELRPGRTAGIHPTGEGYLYISAHSTHFWQSLCDCLGLPQLAADPRYDDMRKRAERADELLPLMHAALATRTAEEWERIMLGKVPCARVRQVEDMFDDPQIIAEHLVTTLDHPRVGRYRTMTKPIVFSDTPGPPDLPAPVLGEHTDEILREIGYSNDAIDVLRRSGVVA